MSLVPTGNIVLPYTSTTQTITGDDPLKYAHIGYVNLATSLNITASSESAGFPASNLSNPLTAHRWKPSALPATVTISLGAAQTLSYFAIASHSLSTNECSIEFQYSTNGGSSYTTIDSYSPSANRAIMPIFSILAKDWRIRISRNVGSVKTGMPSIGVMYVGEALVMERKIYQGHSPITMARKTSRITNKTEGGQYAGSSVITEGVSTSFEWKNISAQWMRDYFDPFILAARVTPFFIAWRPYDYPDEVGFVWTTEDIRPTNTGPRDLMSVSMTVEGYSDD